MFRIVRQPDYFDEVLPLVRLADELAGGYDPGYNCNVSSGDSRAVARRYGDSEVHNTDKEFRVRMDLHHYKPEEVKITSDNTKITINAKHEEKQDNHGYVSREITRIYKLPENVDPSSISSTMNAHGILNIKVQKKALEEPKETPIPVTFK
ncbi:heat shock protein Hsp-12.2-like [Biomphalaria glabrata]|uniref:Heat shock protein Hsp-12.2-like n=3 Tax=Biomphalaria TaxID=6525 RepID=A0A9U8EGG6_BIOGL|nr:heat shock protein Hsp-12.2-like [Biomphalaria glabrata]KAI8738883.1 heat shock protein Hsp-12.2-like [Biomphalaria glabrata]KAK0043193.1 heat shock protein Hsp-12.2 [Biomphalaria pfeifferi]